MDYIYFPKFDIINRFLEDSCVITTLAYLVGRGTLLPRLFNERRLLSDQVALAVVFGLAGGSEMIFPGERYPYVIFTLMAAFAGYAGGLLLGVLTSVVMVVLALASFAIRSDHFALALYVPSITIASLIGTLVGKLKDGWEESRHPAGPSLLVFLLGASFAGGVAEAIHRFLIQSLVTGMKPSVSLVFYSICANCFGSFIIGLVLWDAQKRHTIGVQQVKFEREIAGLRMSQLEELQARLHPHFLFNALAALAGLCIISPSRAERGISDLAALLRHFLRTPAEVSIALCEEMETVRCYLAIEQLRMDERLVVEERIPEDLLSLRVPRFVLQVPVENAVQHGVAQCPHGGTVVISARRNGDRLLLAVSDTGPGILKPSSVVSSIIPVEADRPHGLTLLALRLQLAYGEQARMRLFSAPGRGTLCVIRLPVPIL